MTLHSDSSGSLDSSGHRAGADSPRLLYLFDPLCGWCYASAPALAALGQAWPHALSLHPSGLFAGAGARELTPQWGEYAWTNDQRIAAMTGQVFSQAYRSQVLMQPAGRFDSTAMNRALTLVAQLDPGLEPSLLHSLQLARYVDGQDTAAAEVVGRLAARLARQAGHAVQEGACVQRLQEDEALAHRTQARIAQSQVLMAEVGARGVPQLLLAGLGGLRPLPSAVLYQGGQAAVEAVREAVGEAVGKAFAGWMDAAA